MKKSMKKPVKKLAKIANAKSKKPASGLKSSTSMKAAPNRPAPQVLDTAGGVMPIFLQVFS